jgi:hypothetical protein
MITIKRGLMIGVAGLFLVIHPGTGWAQDSPAEGTQAVIALLKEQNSKLSGDLRRIQREIAALRADLNEPGMENIFSGIGYILGLFGTAAFVAARRRKE